MESEPRERIIQLLETYHVRERKIALLHYELEHPAQISPNEMLKRGIQKVECDVPHGAPDQGASNHKTGADVRLCRRQSLGFVTFMSCLCQVNSPKMS